MPLYAHYCSACTCEWSELRSLVDYDKPATCPDCGLVGERLIKNIRVMNAALPDGTKRFDGIRKARAIEDEKRHVAREERKKFVKQGST